MKAGSEAAEMKNVRETGDCIRLDCKRNLDMMKELNALPIMGLMVNCISDRKTLFNLI
jgi:hypothetical protein